ncbi:hypothetical protein L7F22_035141 [Adiantum nelumboides]|nr:hypothetical protein [Adiantum nelumboides]
MAHNNTYVFKIFVVEDKLDGDNYPMWAYMMQHVLVSKGVWNIVKGIDVRLGSEDVDKVEDVAGLAGKIVVVRLEVDCHKVLNDCFDAYKKYLHETSKDDEALGVISGSGCTPNEIAFMWMGRWRPTSGIVLVYSTMGLDPLVSAKGCIKNAVQHSSFGHALNEQQLSGLNALQAQAFMAESNISKQLAVIQMLLVEQDAVSMLHLEEPMSDKRKDLSDFQKLIDARLLELQSLLRKADDLRLHTLRELLDLLAPAQVKPSAICKASFSLIPHFKAMKAKESPWCKFSEQIAISFKNTCKGTIDGWLDWGGSSRKASSFKRIHVY